MWITFVEEADLIEELPRLCNQMVIEFVCLCEGCLRNDGFVSFVQNHLVSILHFPTSFIHLLFVKLAFLVHVVSLCLNNI